MPAAEYALIIEQGAKFSRVLTFTDSAGAPINLTGFEAWLHVKRDFESAETLLELSTDADDGITLTTPLAGVMTVIATSTQTAEMPVGPAVFDLLVDTNDGAGPTRFLQGPVEVRPRVTIPA